MTTNLVALKHTFFRSPLSVSLAGQEHSPCVTLGHNPFFTFLRFWWLLGLWQNSFNAHLLRHITWLIYVGHTSLLPPSCVVIYLGPSCTIQDLLTLLPIDESHLQSAFIMGIRPMGPLETPENIL